VVVLGGAGVLFWLMVFAILLRLLRYFRAAPGVGELLAVKLLGLILLSFLAILLLSNIITALSSFFLARDLELLAAAPVDGVRLYVARLIETAVNSRDDGAVLVPILSRRVAFGKARRSCLSAPPPWFASWCCRPSSGTAVTQLLVNIFPRAGRGPIALIALFGAAAVILLFRLLRPEQLARPEGFRDLVDFIGALRTPQSPWLPSEWAAEAMLAPLSIGGGADWFPLLLLASTAAAFLVLGAWLHGRLYHDGLSRSQEGAELQQGEGARARLGLEQWLAGAPVRVRSLVAKDIRTFFRDTTQWSQLVLLAVLVVVYTYNIKVLPIYQGEEVGALLVSIISFLNLGLAGFVLAAISARFLFPAVSLRAAPCGCCAPHHCRSARCSGASTGWA
jgi:ABC-2 type transport system permease protein